MHDALSICRALRFSGHHWGSSRGYSSTKDVSRAFASLSQKVRLTGSSEMSGVVCPERNVMTM